MYSRPYCIIIMCLTCCSVPSANNIMIPIVLLWRIPYVTRRPLHLNIYLFFKFDTIILKPATRFSYFIFDKLEWFRDRTFSKQRVTFRIKKKRWMAERSNIRTIGTIIKYITNRYRITWFNNNVLYGMISL